MAGPGPVKGQRAAADEREMTVLMPFPTPFYAPLAAGVALGHFAREGLHVTVTTAGAFGKPAVQALRDGDVDIALSGLMRSLELADRGGPRLVHFAEVCSKNGFFLLARRPMPAFRWTQLAGSTVLSFAEAPTPWQCLLTVLRRNGVDPSAVRIDRSRPTAEAVAAFRAGQGDFLEQAEPAVETLVAEGAAVIVASMGVATGPVPFTSYMATPDFLARDRAVAVRFTRAVARTQRWLAGHAATDIAPAVAAHFPDVPAGVLERAVARYRQQDTWARTPVLGRAGYDALHQILLDGGLIQRTHRYADLVDTAIATEALESLEGDRAFDADGDAG
jgi:NitT/TauT family transport system substrate-binding protein